MDVEDKEETPCAVLPPPDQNFQFGPIFSEKEDWGDQNFGPRTVFAGTKIPVTGPADEKLANTTTARRSMRYIYTYPGNGYNGSVIG